MPITPSDLEWWAWLLIALGAGLFAALMAGFASVQEKTSSAVTIGLVAFVSGAASLIAGIIGIVRFIKWVWVS